MFAQLIKRTLPQSLQRRIHDGAYRYLGLRYRLNSGVEISIGSKTDWLSYNTIFFSAEYDSGILPLREHPGSGAVVLDLGCNTGFFALRCLDVLGPQAFDGRFKWIAVDASAEMLGHYRERVLKNNGLDGRIQLVQGLVGKRSGTAMFYESTNTGANTCIPEHVDSDRRYSQNRVPFVDLEALVPVGPIALIKCDIEGSEGDFIMNYRSLLRRAESLIFEFHDCCADQGKLFEMMKAEGFVHQTVRASAGSSIEFFFREKAA
jgi:FkbM family methyltransferase